MIKNILIVALINSVLVLSIQCWTYRNKNIELRQTSANATFHLLYWIEQYRISNNITGDWKCILVSPPGWEDKPEASVYIPYKGPVPQWLIDNTDLEEFNANNAPKEQGIQ